MESLSGTYGLDKNIFPTLTITPNFTQIGKGKGIEIIVPQQIAIVIEGNNVDVRDLITAYHEKTKLGQLVKEQMCMIKTLESINTKLLLQLAELK
jgi:hypothetical protein